MEGARFFSSSKQAHDAAFPGFLLLRLGSWSRRRRCVFGHVEVGGLERVSL